MDKTELTNAILTGIEGLKAHWREDLSSGFLVFLIALPLSLGIAVASGLPAMAGVISAVIGGVFVSRVNGSVLTITGPAAGLIVVVLDAVTRLGEGDPLAGYQFTLAAILVAGLLQVVLGYYKAGSLSAFFPTSVVHGMLAAIGIIIMTKQFHVLLGVTPDAGDLFSSIAQIPQSIFNLHADVAFIGISGLLILIFWHKVNHPLLQKVPAPIAVVLMGIVFGWLFGLQNKSIDADSAQLASVENGSRYLVAVSNDFFSSFYAPDFSKFFTFAFWQSVIAICLVGSLETLISTQAVDKLDPEKRHSDLDKDLTAVGAGNALAGMLGGTMMISEVVRSSANIRNCAKTGWANFFHGLIMLMFVVFFAGVLQSIPLAALAALLIYVGFQLAAPKEFFRVMNIGSEQFLMFLVTIISVLATDLLIGVLIGIVVKLSIHMLRGVWWDNLFTIYFTIEQKGKNIININLNGSALFCNFLPLKKALDDLPQGKYLIFDLSNAYLIDHTVMEYLHNFMQDYKNRGGKYRQEGDSIHTFSDHDLAARLMTHDDRKQ
jgi:MFS superfamily sulfate permease-like transporter